MIQVNSSYHHPHTSNRTTRSHILTPHDSVTLMCIIDGEDESILSILEDHLLENIASTSWDPHETSHDFGYVTAHYNTFVAGLDREDLLDIRILLAMIQGEELTLSTVGGTHGAYIDPSGDLIDITVHENQSHAFISITTGKIPAGSTVYLANDDIEQLLGKDLLAELSDLPAATWGDTSQSIISRELMSNLYMIRISNKIYTTPSSPLHRKKMRQSDILRHHGVVMLEYIRSKRLWERTRGIIQKIPTLENPKYQLGFLCMGVILLVGLAYSLISSILGVLSTSTNNNRSLLTQAQFLIEESQKLSSNPTAFTKKISEAESILIELRKEQKNIPDTQKLLSKIAIIKKTVYDIQSVDMINMISIVPIDTSKISPLGVIEKDKKLTVIGEAGAILGYVPGDSSAKIIPYPGGEKVKSFDSGEDGAIYILTTENHILAPRRDQFAYMSITGQPAWEDATSIKTFNGNIYLLGKDRKQIQRHKPGVNGFSQQSELMSTPQSTPMLDMSIDGGVYLYMEDGRIQHYTGNKEQLSPILLNKIPGEWSLDTTRNTTFVTRSYLTYTYILNGDTIWIFQPDSKRFQDVKSWNYMGQFELTSTTTIKSISVPRDGTIYVTTENGIYDLRFETIDNKIIFKSK